MMGDYKPFKDLKVIELASVLAGPSVGMFFAELGAKVIKVENAKTNGDVTRSWKLASEDQAHPYSAYYSSVNWGKESWMLDLKDAADQEKLLEEVKDADIVISNFRPSSAAKLGLSAKELKAINPKLIYGEILGFRGQKRLAYDVVLQAECGYISMNGSRPGEEAKWPLAIIDLFAAHQLKEGLLIALLERERSGKAAHVSASLFESGLANLSNQATNWLMANHIPQPMGSLHPNIAPYGETFSCKDGKEIILAVGSNSQFKALCDCLKVDLISDERFKDNQSRVKHRKEMAELLEEPFRQYNRADLMQKLIDAAVPAGAIRNVKEVFELEKAQEQLLTEEKEGRTLTTVSGNGFQLEF
jgi:crotonobetainyl-CoA:carnitine CoA-transferase CaiB-like acyl-CoA transferase